MTDSYILVQGTAQKLDTRQVTTGVGTVERQVGAIGDPLSGGGVARIGAGVAADALRVTIATDQQTQTPGALVHHRVSTASTNATVVKGSAGKVLGVFLHSAVNAYRKVAFHDTAATPTAGTTAVKFAVGVPANGAAYVPFPVEGVAFSTGIAFTMVTGMADNSAVAVGASEISLEVVYV